MTCRLFAFLLLLWAIPAISQEAAETTAAVDTEIQKSLAEYVEAFNRADLETLGHLWAEDAVYLPAGGDPVQGREAILNNYRQLFQASPGVTMEIALSLVTPATEGWANETGISILTHPDGLVEESHYEAVLRKVGDTWQIQSVLDVDAVGPAPHSEHLEALEWLIGSWRDEGDGMIVDTTYEWSANRNSILGKISVQVDGEIDKEGLIVIGWDPIDQNIRSWTFDSQGGTAEGSWYEKDGKWISKALHVLPDGRTGTSTRVFQKLDENSLEWKAVNRVVDGEILPSVGPVRLTRLDSGAEESK